MGIIMLRTLRRKGAQRLRPAMSMALPSCSSLTSSTAWYALRSCKASGSAPAHFKICKYHQDTSEVHAQVQQHLGVQPFIMLLVCGKLRSWPNLYGTEAR